MKYKKLLSTVSVVLCVVLLTNITALAVNTQPEAAVESISIYNQSGVLEGETIQLKASIESSSSLFGSVEWSSSNPNVISCTEDGKIKGLVAGESAIITCKAKWSSAKDSIKVYCVEKFPSKAKSGLKYILTFVYSQPGSGFKDICFDLEAYLGPMYIVFRLLAQLFSNTSSDFYLGSKVSVLGKIKSYAYIRYGESDSLDGFLKYTDLKNPTNEFLNISSTDMPVWANGITYANRKLTTAYDGNVEWIVGNDKYIDFDESTGQITGLSEGVGKTTTVTAKADGMTAYCTIHLLYKWEQAWTTKTNKDTSLYAAKGKGYNAVRTLPVGTKFVVQGDCGTDSGWAYGYFSIGEKDYWGFVPIEDISTKGTVSQYNNLTTTTIIDGKEKTVPWFWPVITPSNEAIANYISSPYGKRDTNPTMHKGMDITNGVSSNDNFDKSVDGYEVVSAFSGKVIYISTSSTSSTGYCVGIKSNKKDPVSGEYFVAFYMHLKDIPLVSWNKEISAGELLGYVGNTGNSKGSHLHFEVNNKNASIGDGSTARDYYSYLINPLFFYMDKTVRINYNCDAETKYYGSYWYGND